MAKELDHCMLCPRKCGVNRNKGEKGFCKAGNRLRIGRCAPHYWEEPCLSGKNGSGTIFFSYCNLKCIYCQNYELSEENKGKEVLIKRFSEICLELQEKGVHNINLVTPTHFLPLIRKGLKKAKKMGLKIPIVYNTSGYETKESIASLEGLIDIYLPDFKYYYDDLAINYSNCPNYFSYAQEALQEMVRQVGSPQFDKEGMMQKGVIVRHLILPNRTYDSKKVLSYLYETYHDQIFISIMNQYTVVRPCQKYPELNRSVTKKEYDEVIDYAISLGIKNGFIQEGETDQTSFIPSFNGEGV